MPEKLKQRYRISVNNTSELGEVEHSLSDLGFQVVRKRPAFHALEVDGPMSAKTQLKKLPGVEHVVTIRVQKGD